MAEVTLKLEKVQGDKDNKSEAKDNEIRTLKKSVKDLESEVLKLKDEAAQDRLLSNKPVRVVSAEQLNESSINHPRGLPEDEDSVEIDFL
jgi:hypothetical protein